MKTCIHSIYDIPLLPTKPSFITLCQTLLDLCWLLPKTQAPEVIVSVLALTVLIVVKELNACYRKKLLLPIPIELIVVGLLLWPFFSTPPPPPFDCSVAQQGGVLNRVARCAMCAVAQSYLNCGASSFNRSLWQQSLPTSVILEINTASVSLERFPVGKHPPPTRNICYVVL